MFISGFTIIRNAVKNDYPIKEAILSILPLVEEMIVLVGNSEDDTLSLIQQINSEKIKIHHSIWDETIREGGKVLAVETDKALALIDPESTWAFYIQADEVIHEKYYENIIAGCKKYANDNTVQGLLFNYVHFYGNYNYVGTSRAWYRQEVRIIKTELNINSYRDAQGFRIGEQKLAVKEVDAAVFHYGWVKTPKQMLQKRNDVARYWDDKSNAHLETLAENDFFNYNDFESLGLYSGTHPAVMQARISSQQLNATFDISKKRLSFSEKILLLIEKITGYRPFTFRNYKKI